MYQWKMSCGMADSVHRIPNDSCRYVENCKYSILWGQIMEIITDLRFDLTYDGASQLINFCWVLCGAVEFWLN